MRIGHKLTLGFVGLTLLIAAIGYVSLHRSQSTLEKAIGENSATLASQILDQIQKNIHHRIEIIQAYTKDELAKNTSNSRTHGSSFYPMLPATFHRSTATGFWRTIS